MKRVVFLGAGHAHLEVLQAFAREPCASAQLLLVTPGTRQVYSGRLPAWVAGHCDEAACCIELAAWVQAAGARLVEGLATRIDTAARCVHLADGRVAEYDVLSLDVGGVVDRDAIPGAREHALFVRPAEHFVRLFTGLDALAAERVLDIVVVGGGAAGFELACALQHRFAANGQEQARVALVTGGAPPLAGYPPRAMRLALDALKARRITVLCDSCAGIDARSVQLGLGARLACDAPVIATGTRAPPWLASSGLALDEAGFVLTSDTLQSVSHPEVLAAGDAAVRAQLPHARSGVYAVRAGPALAQNLRRLVAGGALLPHQAPRRTLNLLACGGHQAIAVWGHWAAAGGWAWHWKNRIDGAYMARFTAPVRAA